MYLPIMIKFEFIGDPFTTLAFGASIPYVVAERGSWDRQCTHKLSLFMHLDSHVCVLSVRTRSVI